MSAGNTLLEPLLSSASENENQNDENNPNNSNDVEEAVEPPQETCVEEENADVGGSDDSDDVFSIREEIWEMSSLGFPLAVSFFCRMGMASTDSAFVGHIHNGGYSPEIYLAAAVLSDMCINVFLTPPLAFNQVLNGLVGQAMGSGNPKMAGIWLQQSMFWLAISMVPFLLAMFYVEPVLLFLDFSPDVSRMAGKYAKFNILWPIPNGLYQCMRFYFQAQGMPRPAMYNNICFLFVNALLNWVFVFGGPFASWDGFGFVGAAMSLSISRTSQSLVYFCYMFLYKQNHLATWPDAGWSFRHHTWDRTKEFMKQSLPNIGTLLFQTCASQATTILVGRLGEGAIAASSALSTVSYPLWGTLGVTASTISSVRTGYHLGRGKGKAANQSAWLVIHFITLVNILVAVVFVFLRDPILRIATDDEDVLSIGRKLITAMLIGNYVNCLVNNITSGVFSGMGRPILATILSFGLELPMSIGGVAILILVMHGDLLDVYWWTVISGGVEAVIVFGLLFRSDWNHWADEARRRQEAGSDSSTDNDDNATEDNTTQAETDTGVDEENGDATSREETSV